LGFQTPDPQIWESPEITIAGKKRAGEITQVLEELNHLQEDIEEDFVAMPLGWA